MVDSTIVKQRARNRQIEWFELSQDIDAVAKIGVFEFINMFFDFDLAEVRRDKQTTVVWTERELSAYYAVREKIDILAQDFENDTWDTDVIVNAASFNALQGCANRALHEFRKRGKFDEYMSQFD